MVRGTCIMPGGLGKKIKIAVLTSESQGLVAKEVEFFLNIIKGRSWFLRLEANFINDQGRLNTIW